MDLNEAIRRRRMVRSFRPDPVDAAVVDGLCDLARRAPSAGNTQAVQFVVLDDPESVRRYWDTTLPPSTRAGFRWSGLLVAPVLILVTTSPAAYVARYAEEDKRRTGLGAGPDAWPVPYWWVDAGAAAEHLLLGAVEAGLGACLFGPFEHEQALAEAFGLPPERRVVATVAVGHRSPDEPGRSVSRPRPPVAEVIHRGRW